MGLVRWYCIIAVLLASLFSSSQAIAEDIELNGNWQFQPTKIAEANPETKPEADATWLPIRVPDNWFHQGFDISGKAWYRRQFQIKAETLRRHVRLEFGGVDYIAQVWLNGHYLGRHEGYFQPFDFNVTSHLKAGNNELLVLVDSPLEDAKAWSFNKRLLKGIFSHHDTRPGGAWSDRGQEQNTGGIWAPVHLAVSDQIAVRDVQVVSKPQGQAWKVEAVAAIDSDQAGEVIVDAIIQPENFSGASYTYKQSQQLVAGQGTLKLAINIDKPQLWWPIGHGQPNLYRLKLKVLQNGRLLEQRDTVFGLREVRVDDATQQWLINGKRLFLRGTNYISSQWLGEMTPPRYRQDLKLMQQANINAIRVHAHLEAPAFYEACDRNGMLVMQDYLLQWGYSDDAAFVTEARRQALDMVQQHGNHPSIVAWIMHNEPPWDAPWMQTKYQDWHADKNLQLDNLLFQDISKRDPSRVVRRESPTKEHEWIGWYMGKWQDFAQPTQSKWITEFGAQALPGLPSLRRMFTEAELWPDTDQKWEKWGFHNFQRNETFNIAQVSMGNNIDEFIHNTQAYQAKLTQFAAESYRRQRYSPVTAIFQFMFVEDWPSINWGVLDYWRQPKLGYAALRTAYQPILPSIEWKQEKYGIGENALLGLWLINDTWQDLQRVQYLVEVDHDGQRIPGKALTVDLVADSGRKLEDLKIEHLESGIYTVKVKVMSAAGKLLGQNQHQFSVVKPQ